MAAVSACAARPRRRRCCSGGGVADAGWSQVAVTRMRWSAVIWITTSMVLLMACGATNVIGVAIIHSNQSSPATVEFYRDSSNGHASSAAARPPATVSRSRTHHQPSTDLQLPRRKRAATDEEEPDEAKVYCTRFNTPNTDNNTFFSPIDPQGFVNTYPKDADCTFVLEAPAGYLIKLDFRYKFHIEPSTDCEFDYLEIHDGRHGFSKSLGKFCGTEFPPIIYSSERYLWLHFHSDENIEYEGFQAEYEFMPKPQSAFEETLCSYTRNGSEGFIKREDIDPSIVEVSRLHKTKLDCLFQIEVEEGFRILLTFPEFQLERKNDCENNFIDVFGEVTDIPSRLKNFCGVIAESVVSKKNILHIRFYAEAQALDSKFSILYTAFRQVKKEEECRPDEFDCDDDTCIAGDLRCNENFNCKFLKDEADCPKKGADKETGNLVIIIVVFCLILAAMISAFLYNCIRKLIRDQKIIREHIRQSKESKLDEAGRMSLKRSLENINRIAPRNQDSLSKAPPQKQRSIHIVDDESNRYYQETVLPHHPSVGPMSPPNTRIDLKNEHNFRNLEFSDYQIKDILDASLRSDKSSDDLNTGNVCDMACQTRESLFAPNFGNKTSVSSLSNKNGSSTLPSSNIRFSTFGYPDPDAQARTATLRRQTSSTTNHSSSAPSTDQSYHSHHQHPHRHHSHLHQFQSPLAGTTQTMIEMEQFGPNHPDGIPPPPPPAVIPPSKCSKHQQHLQHLAKAEAAQKNKNDANKLEESRIFVDIRNSAPDVIIMTSH